MTLTKWDGQGTIRITRRQLLRELMELPLSAWMKCAKSDSETTFDFILGPTNYGYVVVMCEDEFGERIGLYVRGSRLCGANLLYRRLTGNWTRRMVRRFTGSLKQQNESAWQHAIGSDWYKINYLGDEVILTRKRDGLKPRYELTINSVMIPGDWRTLLDFLINRIVGSHDHSLIDKDD